MRRELVGSSVGIALAVAFGAAMLPLRPHLSIATAGLVLVLPAVAGVMVGGFVAGVASVAAGFLVYDYLFVPPYGRLAVSHARDWVTLVVYVLVMVAVARVVGRLRSAQAEAQRRTRETERLFDLSNLLVEEASLEDLLESIVATVRNVFDVPGVALLVPDGDRLELAATAGEPLTKQELRGLEPLSGLPVSLGNRPGLPDEIRTVALIASGRPIGMLAMRGLPSSDAERAVLGTFANHAALALERVRLREQALRSEVLEEVDRLRHALVGAVSHDLRTPLATMKVASTTLLDADDSLSNADRRELHHLIDVETDRLTRLVDSLLDMTRIDSGALEVRLSPQSILELIHTTVASLRPALGDRPVRVDVPDVVVDMDPLLIGQVLANLMDNANRHGPETTVIEVSGVVTSDRLALAVADAGPGVPSGEREAVFDRFVRFDTGGRAGLGLTIAKTFVEAHGERIWVEDAPDGGARFVFTLPIDRAAPPAGTDGRPEVADRVTGSGAVGSGAVGSAITRPRWPTSNAGDGATVDTAGRTSGPKGPGRSGVPGTSPAVDGSTG